MGGMKKVVMHVLERAAYSVFCEEEANLHYGDKFTQIDRAKVWLSGALDAIKSVFASKVSGIRNFRRCRSLSRLISTVRR
ncbi:hypothetical protein EXT65_21585 [Pectobacterium carotovorum subsp. carotovorum]|nr:hypothetical protein [Pectobacterium carotovorum]MCL6336389.1 hypothetical protein [Pectobacterium carotovorum subsp. carotovorum]